MVYKYDDKLSALAPKTFECPLSNIGVHSGPNEKASEKVLG